MHGDQLKKKPLTGSWSLLAGRFNAKANSHIYAKISSSMLMSHLTKQRGSSHRVASQHPQRAFAQNAIIINALLGWLKWTIPTIAARIISISILIIMMFISIEATVAGASPFDYSGGHTHTHFNIHIHNTQSVRPGGGCLLMNLIDNFLSALCGYYDCFYVKLAMQTKQTSSPLNEALLDMRWSPLIDCCCFVS